MNLGQLLGGAGVVGSSMRAEEDAQRQSRQRQLQTDEMNRLRAMQEQFSRDRMASQMVGETPQFAGLTEGQPFGTPPAPAAAPVAPAVNEGLGLRRMTPAEVARLRQDPYAMGTTAAPAAPVASGAPASDLPSAIENLGVQFDAAKMAQLQAVETLQRFGSRQRQQNPAGYQAAVAAEARARQARETAQQAYETAAVPFTTPVQLGGTRLMQPAAAPAAAAQLPNPQQLLQAMIRVESAGKPGAVSPKGAIGLMQVMPASAMNPGFGLPNVFDFAEQMGTQVGKRNEAEAKRLLADPTIGAAYGQRFMDAMLQRYNGNLEYALAAYNAGPGRVDKWLAAGADFSKLPKETREYIPKVLAAMAPAGAAPAAAPTGATPAAAAAPAAAASKPIAAPGTTPAKVADAVVAAAKPAAPASGGTMYGPAAVDASANNPMIKQVLSERQALVNQVALMEQYGFGDRAMQLVPQIKAIDLGLYKAQADQGIYEGASTGNFSRAMSMLSYFRGVPHQVLDRGDRTYDLYIGGKVSKTAMPIEDLADLIRSNVDDGYRQQKAALAGKRVEQQMKIEEIVAEERIKAAGNMQVALVNAQAKLIEQGLINAKTQLLQLGDGRVVQYTDGKTSIINFADTEVRGTKIPTATRIPVR